MIEIGVENADLVDRVDRNAVLRPDASYRLGRGGVVNAEGLLLVGRDVGMDPADSFLRVVGDDSAERFGTSGIHRHVEAVGKCAFDQISGHSIPPDAAWRGSLAAPAALRKREP